MTKVVIFKDILQFVKLSSDITSEWILSEQHDILDTKFEFTQKKEITFNFYENEIFCFMIISVYLLRPWAVTYGHSDDDKKF